MRMVKKGKLAGKIQNSEEELGLAALNEEDRKALLSMWLNQLCDGMAYVNEDGIVEACSNGLLEGPGLRKEEVLQQRLSYLGQSEEQKTRIMAFLNDIKDDGEAEIVTKIQSSKARAMPTKMKGLRIIKEDGSLKILIVFYFWFDHFAENSTVKNNFLHQQNDFDHLTGLLNREAFLMEAHGIYEREEFKDRPCVMILDIKNMTRINKIHGQEEGDKILQVMAERLKQQIRRGDLCARLGGDRFAIYASFAGLKSDAEAIKYRIMESLDQPLILKEGLLDKIEITMGIALGPEHGTNIKELLSSAEMAIKHAKIKQEVLNWAERI